MTHLARQRGPPGVRRARAPYASRQNTKTKGQNIMSVKTNRVEKAIARMRKLEEQRRRAAEQEQERRQEVESLCGQALMNAASGGEEYGEYVNKPVAELAVTLGLLGPDDEAVKECAQREFDRLCGEALRSAVTGGELKGFLHQSVAELAGYLGLLKSEDEDQEKNDNSQNGEGQNGEGA